MLRRLALSHPEVEFKLLHDGKSIFEVAIAENKEKREARIAALLGEAFMEAALFIEYEVDGIKLSGWIGEPYFNRAQADMQFSFVNQRFVRDKVISHALRQAYQDVMYGQRQAVMQ